MDSLVFKNASEHIKFLLNCVICSNCKKLIKEPQTGVCQHDACARCWGSSGKVCTVCKKSSGTRGLHPNVKLASYSDAITKLAKAFYKVSGINVEESEPSESNATDDKDSDCFIEKDMEYNNLKTYKHDVNKSLGSRGKLKHNRRTETPIVFPGEAITSTEEVVNISKKDKVEGWLKSSENVFVQKSNDEELKVSNKTSSPLNKNGRKRSSQKSNDEELKISNKTSSPLNKNGRKRSSQKINASNDSGQKIASASTEFNKTEANSLSVPASNIDGINEEILKNFFENALPQKIIKLNTRKQHKESQFEPTKTMNEKENKRDWKNIKKAKKIFKTEKTKVKLNISFNDDNPTNLNTNEDSIVIVENLEPTDQNEISEVMMKCQSPLDEVIPVVEINSSESGSPFVEKDFLALQEILELSKQENADNITNKNEETFADTSDSRITHLVTKKSTVKLSGIKNVISKIENEFVSDSQNMGINSNFDKNEDSQMIDKELSKLLDNNCNDSIQMEEIKKNEQPKISENIQTSHESCKNAARKKNVCFMYRGKLDKTLKKPQISKSPNYNENLPTLQCGYNFKISSPLGIASVCIRHEMNSSIEVTKMRDAQTSPISNINDVDFIDTKCVYENRVRNTRLISKNIETSCGTQTEGFKITESIEKEMEENKFGDLEEDYVFLSKFTGDVKKQTVEPISKHVSEILHTSNTQKANTSLKKSKKTTNTLVNEDICENFTQEYIKDDTEFNFTLSSKEVKKRLRTDENSYDVISPNPPKKQKSEYDIPLDDNIIVNFQSQTENFDSSVSRKKIGIDNQPFDVDCKNNLINMDEKDKKIQQIKQSLAVYNLNSDEKSMSEIDNNKQVNKDKGIECFDSDFDCDNDSNFSADVVEDTPQKARTVERLLKKKTNNSEAKPCSSVSNVGANSILNEDFASIYTPQKSSGTNKEYENTQRKQNSSQNSGKKAKKSFEISPRAIQTRSMNTPASLKRFTSNIKYRSTPTQPYSRRSLKYGVDENIPAIMETTEIVSGSSFQKLSNQISNDSNALMENEFMEQAFKPSLIETAKKNTTRNSLIADKSILANKPEKVCISCSCLTMKQKNIVKLFANQMDWMYTDDFNDHVTHLIVKVDDNNQCQRSLKYIQSLAAGCWIVSWKWIKECINSQLHVEEDDFEVLDFFGENSPYRLRVSKVKLFTGITFFTDPPFSQMSNDVLKKILTKAGGKVVDTMNEIKIKDPKKICILLAEPDNTQDDRYEALCMSNPIVPVNLEWVLESLGKGRFENIADWLLCMRTFLPTLDWPTELLSDDD